MISIKSMWFVAGYFFVPYYGLELVPSSARSTSSSASPLAPQFVPLLSSTFDRVKEIVGKVLPINKKVTALEEAEWEEDSEENAFQREMTNQCQSRLLVDKSPYNTDIVYSDGNVTDIPSTCGFAWVGWYGPRICRTCRITSSGRLSCSEP